MNDLVDERFTGLPLLGSGLQRSLKKAEESDENIEKFTDLGDWSEEQKLEKVNLTGVSINAVVTPRVRKKLDELYVPPISEFDPELVTWFVPRECKLKKSKNGKNFVSSKLSTTTMKQQLSDVVC